MNYIANLQRAPRAYEPVWKLLRQKGKVTLEIADPVFVNRIKRMISKEKDMDTGFKILNELESPRLRYKYDPEKRELEIRLIARYGIVDIQG